MSWLLTKRKTETGKKKLPRDPKAETKHRREATQREKRIRGLELREVAQKGKRTKGHGVSRVGQGANKRKEQERVAEGEAIQNWEAGTRLSLPRKQLNTIGRNKNCFWKNTKSNEEIKQEVGNFTPAISGRTRPAAAREDLNLYTDPRAEDYLHQKTAYDPRST